MQIIVKQIDTVLNRGVILWSFSCMIFVRFSAAKSLYAEGFAVYYRGRHLKRTSQNRILLTPEKSLTMKLYRSPPNNSDGIVLRSSFDRSSIVLRSGNGERTKNERRMNEG